MGGTNFSAGLEYSVAAIAALIARSGSGNAMDKIGRRPILIVGSGVLIAANLLLFVVSNIPLICLIRFFQGIGWGMASTALATLISDVVPIKRMGEGIGYLALSIVLATSLSIILGIRLMDHSGFMLPLSFSTTFFAAALFLCHQTPAPPFRKTLCPRNEKRNFLATLFEKKALLPAFLCFLHSIVFSGIMAFIMLLGAESGIRNIWVFFVGHLVMIVISRPIAGKIFDRRGHAVIILPGTVFMIFGLVVLSYAHSVVHFVIASMSYGLGFGSVQPSLQAWAINRSSRDRKGAASATFLSSLDLGYASGTILMGFVGSLSSYAYMYRVSSMPLIAFLLVYGFFGVKDKGRARSDQLTTTSTELI